MNSFIETFSERKFELFQALIEHIQLSLLSLLIAIVIAIPIAVYLTKHKKLAELVLQITGVFQTIPSLALLGLLIPFIGIGHTPAIVALVMYALFPILQNTYTGLTEINPSLQEAAEAFGMSKMKKLMKFEIPLALPMIVSGIRTATVLIIGTATLAALIGAGGLGTFILLGIDRNNINLILLGAISSALLAIVFSYAIRLCERANIKQLSIGFVALLVIFGGSLYTSGAQQGEKEIIIAGKLGSEPDIIINMYKELIEANSDINVTLKPNFGKTSFLFSALKSGEIDIYPEFTGTVLETLISTTAIHSNEPEEVFQIARDELKEYASLVYLEPKKFENTYALAVKESFAEQYNLRTISDLKRVEGQIKAGFTLEFIDRDDGYRGIQELYGLQFEVISMEPKLRYQAINNGDVNLIDAYSTDSELKEYGLVVLEDDKRLFPPYQGAPLMRASTLNQFPELEGILNQLSGIITAEEMSQMNYEVNVNGKSPNEVAREFLKAQRLL